MRQISRSATPNLETDWRHSPRNTSTYAEWKRLTSKAACPMFWTSTGCLFVCNRRVARNAGEKQARMLSKTVLLVRRNNVMFRVDMRSKCQVYIKEYKVSKGGVCKKTISFELFFNPIDFIRPMEYNIPSITMF